MASSRPTFVIFDLGNVLVHIHPEAFLRTLGIDTPENRRYYQKSVINIVRAYECGEESTEQFLGRLGGLFNAPDAAQRHIRGHRRVFSHDDFRRAMLSIIGQPVVGMEELVRNLGARVPLGLLSNTNPLHFDACMDDLAVLQFIPSHFLSYRLRSLKPETKIFEKAIELLQLDPGDVFYIDDLHENVEAARRVGLNGSLFVGEQELKQRLSDLGLI
ncbi:MAG: HAD-superfamily hydrolase, subfamily variant 3 [Bacteroidetes bacterium]|nr:HAD-superfamily hydrolase, subfamily variant 3 [Bacteroidota bacterium]